MTKVHVRRLAAITLAFGAASAAATATPASAASPWSAPQPLAAASDNAISGATVGEAPDGTAVAAFLQFDGSHYRVYASVRPAGGTFGASTPISSSTQDAGKPAVALDAQGNTTVAWHSSNDTIVASFRPAGGTFPATPQTVATSTNAANSVYTSALPDIATSGGGSAAIAWTGLSSGVQRAAYAIRAAGAATFGPATLAGAVANGTALYGNPRIASDTAGDLALLWQEQLSLGDGKSHYVMEASVKPLGASLALPVALSMDYSDSNASDGLPGAAVSSVYDVQMTATGRAFAVWDYSPNQSFTNPVVQYAERIPGASFATASWGAAQTIPGAGGTEPVAAGDGKGGITIAYGDGNAVQTSVRTTASGAFQTPKAVSGGDADVFDPIAIAETSAGEATVAWRTANGQDSSVAVAHLAAGQDHFGDTVQVAAQAGSDAHDFSYAQPALSLDSEGNGTLVTALEDYASAAMTASYTPLVFGYDPVPPALGTINVPNAGTAGSALTMTAAATDRSGTPAVTWDFGDGATATGASVDHVYAAPGAYTVTIRATDAAGNASSATKTTLITAAPVVTPTPAPAPISTPVTTPAPIVKLPTLSVTAKLKTSSLKDGRTRVTSLVVSPLLKGDVIAVACVGKGCTKKATTKVTFAPKLPKTKSKKAAKLPTSLTLTALAGLTLKPDATLTVTVTRPGYAPRATTFTMRKKKSPAKS